MADNGEGEGPIDFNGLDFDQLPDIGNIAEFINNDENKGWVLELAKFLRFSALTQLAGYDESEERREGEIRPINIIVTTKDGRILFRRWMLAKKVLEDGEKVHYLSRKIKDVDMTPYIDAIIFHEGDLWAALDSLNPQKKLSDGE